MNQDKTLILFEEIKEIEKKYSLNYEEIYQIIKNKDTISIPIDIFNEKLGSLETIVKYLKENRGLNIQEISFLTNRKPQSIRTTYNRSQKKLTEKLMFSSQKTIPMNVLCNDSFSVLENLVLYLLNSNYSLTKISKILKRDYKTIWTITHRIKNKK